MATFYLDLEGGSDAADGTTFANRWRTFASGATAARIAPGDTVRVMASPDPTLVGTCSWTQNSKTVTLPGAVTANISDCETAWTPLTDVTATADTAQFKEGTKSAKLVISSNFSTGRAAIFGTGTLDLSGYQQVSLWFYNTVAVAASTLSLRLCTDINGQTAAHTFAIPAIPSVNQWVALTFNNGANLNSAINSVALYQDVDITAVTVQLDNIIACKAASSADSLTLTSLIGKVHNLSWAASTAYSLNDKRRPTQPNRNGYQYKCATAGTTGGTEPAWTNVLGNTVADGSAVWTCEELEDTYFPIQSINGTTVKLDNGNNMLGNAGRGYSGATESVATHKREPISTTMVAAAATIVNTVQDSGTTGTQITFSGGWNRTDMSTQTGETWTTGQNGMGYCYDAPSKNYLTFANLNATRYNRGFSPPTSGIQVYMNNCHFVGNTDGVGGAINAYGGLFVAGMNCSNNTNGFNPNGAATFARAITCSGNSQSGFIPAGTSMFRALDVVARNSGSAGSSINAGADAIISNSAFSSNNSSDAGGGGGPGAKVTYINCSFGSATEFAALAARTYQYTFSQKHDQVADNHYIATDGGSIVSAVDQRHTASGVSWKFRPTSTNRDALYPIVLSIEALAVKANAEVTVRVWARRDSTNAKGRLVVQGGQLTGVPNDVVVAVEPSINTWVQSDPLTFTPTEAGVVEVQFWVHDGVGTTNNFWIDDFTASQA